MASINAIGLKCINCGEKYPISPMLEGCPRCQDSQFSSSVSVCYDYEHVGKDLTREKFSSWQGVGLWRFAPLLPVSPENQVSLHEGGTPLIKCERPSEDLGLRVHIKDESRNPTWSYKDRLACVATSKALEFGAKVTTIASTGNHGAATAAYAAKANLDCVVFTVPTTPLAMKSLMQSYGAKVVATTWKGRFEFISHCVRNLDWYPLGTYGTPLPTGNPYGVEGYKTIAYEICLQLNWDVPDVVLCPVANGEGFFGIWKGFHEAKMLGLIDRLPKMVAVELVGGPLANAIRKNLRFPEPIGARESVAFSINGTISSFAALKAIRDSGGTAVEVSDDDIMTAQEILGQEGLYAEPASASSAAGLYQMAQTGQLAGISSAVCIVTSSGLKDPGSISDKKGDIPVIEPGLKQLATVLKECYHFDPKII